MSVDTILEACELQGVVGILESEEIACALLQHLEWHVRVASRERLVSTLLASDVNVGADGIGYGVVLGIETVVLDSV
jgi:hypothetical protein